ncbi:MAG: CBS domain-containing protein [Ignavibacteria bacterium]|nr:CBS domain-containing protein [Ignavibacteria bacterium]
MTTVRNILQSKGPEIWSVEPETPVMAALKIMDEKNIGALVVARGGSVLGILSERDYARKLVLKGRSSSDSTVQDLMTSSVITVTPEQSMDQCMDLMTSKRIRHLPVVENDKLVGLISIGDVVKAVISEKEFLVKQLENYITGAR